MHISPFGENKTKPNKKKTTFLLVDTVHLITLLVISMLECLVANKFLFSFFSRMKFDCVIDADIYAIMCCAETSFGYLNIFEAGNVHPFKASGNVIP